MGLEPECIISQFCQKLVIDGIMSITSYSIREKFPASKFTPLARFLCIKNLLFLHYLAYRWFQLEPERIISS